MAKGTALKDTKLFPTTLYVVMVPDGEDRYPVADETIESFEDTLAVGIYELKEVRRKQVEHSLL